MDYVDCKEDSENKETKNDGMDVNEDCVDGKEISENKEFLKKYLLVRSGIMDPKMESNGR